MDATLGFGLVIWVLCAVLVYWIASERHALNAGTWAVVGFLLGPIGVLLAVMFIKPRTPETQRTPDR